MSTPGIASGHRLLDHTADVALEAWAPSQESLLIEAAQAVIRLITDGAPIPEDDQRIIEIDALDDEDRMVRWLNEVLWLAIGQGFLLATAQITLRQDGLTAQLRGYPHAENLIVAEIKSATYHDLHLAQEPNGRYVARIILDV